MDRYADATINEQWKAYVEVLHEHGYYRKDDDGKGAVWEHRGTGYVIYPHEYVDNLTNWRRWAANNYVPPPF